MVLQNPDAPKRVGVFFLKELLISAVRITNDRQPRSDAIQTAIQTLQ
ncbi:MAG: hypothetical protein AABZ08_00420 [Planctomycetota bacterium]